MAHLLHGCTGVGKTTFARRLEQERRALRFTHDEWMGQMYGRDPPAADFGDLAARVSGVMERMWTRCLALRIDVVLDFGFWTRAERDRVRRLAADCGGEAILYRVDCADDVAWARIERRNRLLADSLYIAPATYRDLRRRFELLGHDEPFVGVPSS